MAWPDTSLVAEVALELNADLTADPTTYTFATDITSYTFDRDGDSSIVIRRGRQDEQTVSPPSTCDLTVDNTDGRFSARNPVGAYYPDLRRNTPIRVRVNPGTGLATRYVGFVSEWPPRWDVAEADFNVPVRAYGVLARVGRGGAPIRSALTRTILGAAPVAFWPLEDPTNATAASSALPGGTSLTVGGTINFAAADTTLIPGIAAAPTVTNGTLSGPLSGMSTTGWSFELVGLNEGGTGLGEGNQLSIYCSGGTIVRWTLAAPLATSLGDSLFLNAATTSSISTAALTFPDIPDPALPHHYRVELNQSGGDIAGHLYVDGVAYAVSVVGQTLGAPYRVVVNPHHTTVATDTITGTVVALAFYDTTTIADHSDAVSGYAGELSGDRFARLCTEESVPYDVAA